MSKRNAFFEPKNYDRKSVNESDGQCFFGYDDEESGTTAWYDEDGNLDCLTRKPEGIWDWLLFQG